MGKSNANATQHSPAEVLIEKIDAVATLSAGEKEFVARAVDLVRLPPNGDKWVYRMVVFFLGLTAFATVLGGYLIAGNEQVHEKLPTGLVALGSACVGALAGLLAPGPKG